jgi:hypothetical protein
MSPHSIVLGSAVSVALLTPSALASFVFVSDLGLEQQGAFTGSLELVQVNATTANLVVTLTNISAAANGGYLTAFAFNVAPGMTVSVSMGSGLPHWQALSNPVDANPLPMFDWGASSSADWQGGGPPAFGIGVGQTVSTTLVITAAPGVLSGLTEASFFDASRTGYAFAARFRGFENGMSDKVVGIVPAPGALALLGLAAAVTRLRRR